MNDELKPCAHCGNTDNVEVMPVWYTSVGDNYHVVCNWNTGGCGAMGGARRTEAEAIAAWNARADDTPELPQDDACAILRKNLHDVGDLGRAMGILEPNELVGGSGDRAYIFECLADLIERDYVHRDSIADDAPEQPVDNVQADSRERLEADCEELIENIQRRIFSGRDAVALRCQLKELLDRQDAITAEETSNAWEEYRDATQREIDELTAERDELREKLREKQHVCDVQRDSFLKLEAENRELQDVCGELERTLENLRGD